eukprot:566291-Pleurochrysis_carterae.AAC.2
MRLAWAELGRNVFRIDEDLRAVLRSARDSHLGNFDGFDCDKILHASGYPIRCEFRNSNACRRGNGRSK